MRLSYLCKEKKNLWLLFLGWNHRGSWPQFPNVKMHLVTGTCSWGVAESN